MPQKPSIIAAIVLASTAVVPEERAAAVEPITRTVYVTVTDGKGVAVDDLIPADFVVKEGGKDREITKAEPASARMRLALAVEERLIGDGVTRVAIFDFMKRIVDAAEISLITIGLRNTTVVDYTTSLERLAGAINSLTLNPRRDSQVAEGVLEISNTFIESNPERPVMLIVAFSGGQAGVEARTVLDKLRQSRATMHSVTLAGGDLTATPVGALGDHSGREEVLGDGPKQSGGRRIEVTATSQMAKAFQQVAADLLSQYVITYTLPDGVKPDKRLSISVKRRSVSLRAPSAIPDR